MKAAVWHGARDVRVEDVAEPGEPAPGRVVVEVSTAAICGSDVAEFRDGPHAIPVGRPHPLTGRVAPLTLGHEYCGRVAAVGEGVDRLAPGDRVCGDSCLRCNRCFWCLRGQYNICELGGSVGLHADGAFARLLDVPDYVLEPVPDAVPDDAAALVEPLAVGMHAVLSGGVRLGDTVVVVGLGMIGATVLLCAREAGAAAVLAVESLPLRRSVAVGLGATEALDPELPALRREVRLRTGGIGADVVFDCTGRAEALASSIELARRGGRIVVVGLPHAASEVDATRLVYFEREVVGALGYRFDHRRVLALLAAGRLDPRSLAGATIELGDVVSGGFERLLSDPAAPLRILVRPGAA